jgi:phosphoglycerate dehydrogenase-like enzyme
MNKRCYVDKSIMLSDENKELLKSKNISCIEFDIKNSSINYNEVEYLLLHSFFPNEKLNEMKKCKYIGIRAQNTDYVDKDISNKYNIVVEGLKEQYGIDAVAEHTFALILGISKNLINSHNNIMAGNWKNGLPLNYGLRGKTISVVGNGKIGRRVAEIAKIFGLKVLIVGKENELKEGEVSINEALINSDIMSIHISSRKENYRFFNAERLKKMKKGSILINTSRGSVMDYVALEEEMENGKFLGVGLDVFPEEPLITSSLFERNNVICTPHLGYLTKESIELMNEELIKNFLNQSTFVQ